MSISLFPYDDNNDDERNICRYFGIFEIPLTELEN